VDLHMMEVGMFKVDLRRWVPTAALVLLLPVPTLAGSISIIWDPASGATGYRVYYGTSSGQYTGSVDVGNATERTLGSLADCTTWYLAVKAYNAAGESAVYSNEVSGWPRPTATSATPNMQGASYTMTIRGANFASGVSVVPDPADTTIQLTSTHAVSCNEIQVTASIDPPAPHIRAAQIGAHTLTIQNPDGVYGDTTAFEVQINPARFDVNRSDEATSGRLDGKDTAWISRLNGTRDTDPAYDPDADLNGDGWVDGEDLAYVAANFGLCWSGSAWNLAACPADLK